jgi:hypothetical protein
MTWRITYTDGTSEITPDNVDKIRVNADGTLISALSTRTYGSDDVVAIYPLANVRKWERVGDAS